MLKIQRKGLIKEKIGTRLFYQRIKHLHEELLEGLNEDDFLYKEVQYKLDLINKKIENLK